MERSKNVLFPGRFQPFHKGHEKIVRSLLSDGHRVTIAVRRTDVSDDNPFTVAERLLEIRRRFERELIAGDLIAIDIPDFTEVVYGRDPGWSVRQVVLESDLEEISATRIRGAKPIWLVDVLTAVTICDASSEPCRARTGRTHYEHELLPWRADTFFDVYAHILGKLLRVVRSQDFVPNCVHYCDISFLGPWKPSYGLSQLESRGKVVAVSSQVRPIPAMELALRYLRRPWSCNIHQIIAVCIPTAMREITAKVRSSILPPKAVEPRRGDNC